MISYIIFECDKYDPDLRNADLYIWVYFYSRYHPLILIDCHNFIFLRFDVMFHGHIPGPY